MRDSEGTERHLGTSIASRVKRTKKEEPKTNNRLCHVFVLGSYWRRERDSEPPFALMFNLHSSDKSANPSFSA